jgi:hypothetical protein
MDELLTITLADFIRIWSGVILNFHIKSIRMKSTLTYYSLLIVCLLLPALHASAQDEKFKAIFIYNFTKYVNWPVSEGNFVINVLGNNSIIGEIQGIATKKLVGSSKIEIKKIVTIAEIGKCHILFISAGKNDLLAEAFQIAKKNNILVITENPNSCKNGSCINFLNKEGRLTFEISKANIEACGLEVSSDLMKLGMVAGN